MNPNDPNDTNNPTPADQPMNNDQGGADTPVPPTPDTTPQPPTASDMGGSPTSPPAPGTGGETSAMGEPSPAAKCHCGQDSVAGNCVGCNQPEAGCSCTLAA